MANKMLIDSSHPEETRVVVVRGQKVEEFDFESASRKQLRGNIYLAKVTRVEPSLQAAFVEYGGNRHGFLAFSEIHPDYYQIPVADRQAIIEEDARANEESEQEEEHKTRSKRSRARKAEPDETVSSESDAVDADSDDSDSDDDSDHKEVVEQLGGDALEEIPERPRHSRRQYKIQEVIKRRQILLVQVVKEERGNKGAALTTYLSLAGRYSVLMPNTGRGGGISRKITNAQDRKRLKEIAHDLDVPEGMGIILRTAGASRTRAEIKRDYEYLMRMWESVRELTMTSSAPALVYEEGSLIKRSIRDLYNKDIDEVLVSGDEGYREAKDFMRMLMPSHAKVVKPYKDPLPLFARYGIEAQLGAMFSNHVTLKSGGYLVINPTEALVSIDVNSGRATREHNIEDTALKTNLEAAEEIARQLRLRDLAGLVVIDFIDMEEKRNNRAVEKRLNECLKNDRARIQVGRISLFGLLEMSRQRIRTGVLESSSIPCPHCAGTGFIRATPSVALHILRSVEETLIKSSSHNIIVRARSEVAFYVLNHKRTHLHELEVRFGVEIEVVLDDTLSAAVNFAIERGGIALHPVAQPPAVTSNFKAEMIAESEEAEEEEDTEILETEEEEEESSSEESNGDSGDNGDDNSDNGRRRRRRRRRGRGRNGNGHGERNGDSHSDYDRPAVAASADTAEPSVHAMQDDAVGEQLTPPPAPANDAVVAVEEAPKPARRGRPSKAEAAKKAAEAAVSSTNGAEDGAPAAVVEAEEEKPKRASRTRKSAADTAVTGETEDKPKKRTTRATTKKAAAADVAEQPEGEAADDKPAPKKRATRKTATAATKEKVTKTATRTRATKAKKEAESTEAAAPAEEPVKKAAPVIEEPVSIALTEPDPNRPKRAGWWSRSK